MRPFCPASATEVTSTTPTVNDSYTPTWSTGGCSLTAAQLLAGGFAYQVEDDDLLGAESVT